MSAKQLIKNGKPGRAGVRNFAFIKPALIFICISFIPGLLLVYYNSFVEYLFLDIKFFLTNGQYPSYDLSEHVVIISIDEYSEQKLGLALEGKGWREHDAALLGTLQSAGAVVFAYDIQYSHEETIWDDSLAAAFREAGKVIICEDTDGITTTKLRNAAYCIAAPDIVTMSGIPRRIFKYSRKTKARTLTFEVLSAYLETQKPAEPAVSSELIDKLDKLESFWINYRYPISFFPIFSYADVIDVRDGKLGNVEKTPVSIFKNKIVLIAKDFPKDKVSLPNLSGLSYFGGLVHAYAIETFLQNSVLQLIPWYTGLGLMLAALIVMQLLFVKAGIAVRWVSIASLFITYWIIGTVLFDHYHVWLPNASFVVSSLLLILLNVAYKRKLLRVNFQKIMGEIQRLEKYNSILEEAAEMREILTDTIVHDIKNSIAAVEGSLIYVSEKYKSDSYTLQTFHAANIACQDIINLSSNLLDVKRIEEGEMECVNQVCPYEEIIEIVNRFTFYPVFFEKKFNILVTPPDFTDELHADRYLIEQIIHNLLNNAFRYTPTAGIIKVDFHLTDIEIIITFFNSGIPITVDQQKIIFNKYIRLGKGRSKYSKGLGLYFCLMAMELHKGRIWVDTDETGNYFHLGFKRVDKSVKSEL